MEFEQLIGKNLFEWALLFIFSGSFLVQLIYFCVFYLRLLLNKEPVQTILNTPITIIVTARNEEERIRDFVKHLLEQRFDSFEIVIVDDFSDDRTLQLIGVLSQEYPQVRFSSISQDTSFSEKLAINLAVKASQSDWILQLHIPSQADSQLVSSLNNFTQSDSSIVFGYSNYKSGTGFYNRLSRLDRFVSFVRSSAFTLGGLPFVLSDNNVFFRKDIYYKGSGFRGKLNQFYANLELILNEYKKRISVAISPTCCVYEDESVCKQDFINLIRKEIKIKRSLTVQKRLVLFFEDFSRLALLVSFVLLLLFKLDAWMYWCSTFLVFSLFLFIIFKKTIQRLNEGKIFLSSFAYILLKPLINIFHTIGMYILDRRNKWN